MKFSQYIKTDKAYKKSIVIIHDVKNLCIGGVGMFLFCTFIIAAGLSVMDHMGVLYIYLICSFVASSLYFWPLIHVKEGSIVVSIFKKFQSIPIDKRTFINAKLFLLMRFSFIFYIPMQIMHFVGLMRTDTYYISVTGFWPLIATVISVGVQYIYMKFQSRNFMI